MNRYAALLGCLALGCLAAGAPLSAQPLAAQPLAAQPLAGRALERLHLPAEGLAFVENRGQWPDEVAFLARLGGVDVWVTAAGLVYHYYERGPTLGADGALTDEAGRGRVVRARFVGGRASRLEGRRPWPTYHNYFLGDDPARWAADVPLYGEVVLHDVYDGVSLRLYEEGGVLRQAVALAAGADPDAFRVEVEGAEGLDLSGAAPLDRAAVLGIAERPTAPLARPEPLEWGEAPWTAQAGGRLRYARYLGGSFTERAQAVAADAAGSVYVVGRTESSDFPTPNGYDRAIHGSSDAFVAHLNAVGGQVYGTYLGASGTEEAYGVAYASQSAYVTGVTSSPNFPTTPGAYSTNGSGQSEQDAFVTRLRPDGSGPVFSTFLGGDGNDAGRAIAVTEAGAVVVGGRTYAANFPAPSGSYRGGGDAFVVVLNGAGTALQSGTFLGGSGLDEARALRLSTGAVYVAGDTDSGDFAGLAGGFGGGTDAFVARLNASGSAVTGGAYIGGSGLEGATGSGAGDRTGSIALALGPGGNVYVAGETSSADFPATATIGARGGTDAFVTRLGPDATSVLGATVFGGSGIDRARGIDVAPDGSVHVAGETWSANFPVQNPDDGVYNGLGDAFLVQLASGGAALLYGTYLGGSAEDRAFDLAIGEGGLTYVVGETQSGSDFPVTIAPPHRGEEDAFVVAYNLAPNAAPVVASPIPDAALALGAEPLAVALGAVFDDPDGDALAYACASDAPAVAAVGDCSGGTLTVAAVSAGSATVTVTATDPGGLSASDAFAVTVTNPPPVVVDPIPDAALALGEAPLVVDLGAVFEDPNGDALAYGCASSAPSVAAVGDCSGGTLTVTPLGEGVATVTVTASDGAGEAEDAFAVTVFDPNEPPVVAAPIPDAALALGGAPLVVDLGLVFDDPDGDALTYACSSDSPGVVAVGDCSGGTLTVVAASAGSATVTVTATDPGGLSAADAFTVTVTNPPPVVASPIPDASLALGGAPLVVDLSAVFEDPNGDALAYGCASSAPSVASVGDCDGGVLTVTPVSAGEATVTVTANDGVTAVTDVFAVTVTNPPPVVVDPIPDAALALGGDPLVVDLGLVFEDPNGDDLTYACASSAPSVAAVGGCAGGTLTVTPLGEGSATVTVTASDGHGPPVSDAFVVTVTNPPPVVERPIPDFPLLLGGTPFSVDLDTVFVDPNGDALTFSFGVDASTVLLSLDGSVLTVTPNRLGAATVTVTANDGVSAVSDAFVVTVTDNLPPVVVAPPADTVLVLGGEPLSVDVTGVFEDPEGDDLAFECQSGDASVAVASDCSGGVLTVAAVAEGEATITVTASDPTNDGVSAAFVVTVVPDNRPPTVTAPIPDAVLGLAAAPLVVDLGPVFDDPDGDDLAYECSSDAPAVVSVSDCSGGVLTVMPESEGEATVTVTATDPDGLGASDVFTVTVVGNAPPVLVSPLPDVWLTPDDAPLVVALDTVFADPEDDPLAFSCSSDDGAVAAVGDCSDGVLTVTPQGEGAATVTVTASDGHNPVVSTDFVVTVVENRSPVVASPIPDAALALGAEPLAVALGAVFDDPDGDALAYACASDAPAVAAVGDCSGGTLTVAAVSAGSATVTVTATDPGGLSASDAFAVTVTNPPPVVVDPIPDAALALGEAPLVVDLGAVFEDPNGDALAYGCASSAPSVAAVGDCSGGTLTVTPLGEGVATVTVTASDGAGEAEDAFAVTVERPNDVPIVADPIPDAVLALGGEPLVVALGPVFEDPDGDDLAYACQSSAPAVASTSGCAGGALTVTAVGEGSATVTVTATDPGGASAEDAFTVTVACDPVSFASVTASPTEPERGSAVTVTAVVGGSDDVALRYRQGGAEAFDGAAMERDGAGFVAAIPGGLVAERGVEYFVEARNACGSTARSDRFALRVRLPSGVASPALPAATEQAGYRLVSVPLVLEEAAAAAVLDDFGPADGEGWRLFQLLPPGEPGDLPAAGTDDQWYREDPAAITVVPGRAFWLIVRDGGSFNTGAGTTLPAADPFGLDLHPGWNLVGTPFGHEVPLERVRTESGAPLQLQAYEGAWRAETARMSPFRGYALFVDGEDRLVVEPPGGGAPPGATRAAGERRAGAREGGGEGAAWSVSVAAELGRARDDNNAALVAPGATEGRDPLDWPEPPPIGDYVSVAFAPPGGGPAPLTVDARPVPGEGASWPLLVRSRLPGEVALTFEGLDGVPAGFVVWLVDEAGTTAHDLRRTPRFSVASPGGGVPARLRLVVGTEAYARAASGVAGTTPSDYRLAPSYPNPFHSVATIEYALPRAEPVVVEVFDVVGRRVATLLDEEVEAGYHRVVWDGRATGGATVLASGTYVVRLRTPSFTATQRAVLVRY